MPLDQGSRSTRIPTLRETGGKEVEANAVSGMWKERMADISRKSKARVPK